MHYTTHRTNSFMTHPRGAAIMAKCLAQGHKCQDRDSNPHSDAEQKRKSIYLLGYAPGHPFSVESVLLKQQHYTAKLIWTQLTVQYLKPHNPRKSSTLVNTRQDCDSGLSRAFLFIDLFGCSSFCY